MCRYSIIIFSISIICLFSCTQKTNEKIDVLNGEVENISKQLSEEQSPRFKIIQSHISAIATFKLDTYTGDVCLLYRDENDHNFWSKIVRESHFADTLAITNRNNYDIFLSGLAIRYTYLINLNTGATWQFCQDLKTKEDFFSAR